MTERLYYRDATLRTFTARVVDATEGGRRLYLARSAFYPTSGGQPNDLGDIDGVPVVDVVDEGERVAHVLATPLVAPPGEVTGTIDWDRRHDHMQQHTGQHLLSAVVEELLGLATASVHFGPEASTLDLAPGAGAAARRDVLAEDELLRVAARANEIVAEARPVTTAYEDAATAVGLRKPSERSGMLRIVTIEGLDRSACGGTHVASTSGIGPVLLRGQERVRTGIRVGFLCGRRALARADRDFAALARMARSLSASLDDVAGLVDAQANSMRELQSQNRKLREDLARHRATALYQTAEPGPDGVRRLGEGPVAGGLEESRPVALAASELPRSLFVAVCHDPPAVLLSTSPDTGIDAGRTLRPLLEGAGGRGGGSARLAQGSVPTPAAADDIARRLLDVARQSSGAGGPAHG